VFGALSSGVHMIDAAQASSEQVRAKTGECGCLWLWVRFFAKWKVLCLGSQVQDTMLEVVRQIEAQVDCQSTPVCASQRCVFGAFSSGVHMIDAAQASSEQVRQVEYGMAERNCGCVFLWVLKLGSPVVQGGRCLAGCWRQ
jgi:hypothetical protein